jgi:hypothetical protein
MANTAISKIVQQADRAKTQLAAIKQNARLSETRMVSSGEILLGGALGGAADAKFGGSTPGSAHLLGVPAVPVVGALFLLLGLSDAVPGSQHLGFIGAGALSYSLGDFVKTKLMAS